MNRSESLLSIFFHASIEIMVKVLIRERLRLFQRYFLISLAALTACTQPSANVSSSCPAMFISDYRDYQAGEITQAELTQIVSENWDSSLDRYLIETEDTGYYDEATGLPLTDNSVIAADRVRVLRTLCGIRGS